MYDFSHAFAFESSKIYKLQVEADLHIKLLQFDYPLEEQCVIAWNWDEEWEVELFNPGEGMKIIWNG